MALALPLVAAAQGSDALSAEQRVEAMRRIASPTLAQGSEALSFGSHHADLGSISEDDSCIEGEFEFVNCGEREIAITRATASCSCLSLALPQGSIAAGESATIGFKYSPAGYSGRIDRRILVYSSLSDSSPSAILTIGGVASASNDNSRHYPFSLGELRMRQEVVRFSSHESQSTERIACINDSQSPIRLSVLASQLPVGLRFWCEPEVIEVGAVADIVVWHDPAVWQGEATTFPLIISGLNVPPSRRTLKIEFEYKK